MSRGTNKGRKSTTQTNTAPVNKNGVNSIQRGNPRARYTQQSAQRPVGMGAGRSSFGMPSQYKGAQQNRYSRYQERYHQSIQSGSSDNSFIQDPVSSWIPYLLLAALGIVVCIVWYIAVKNTSMLSVMTMPEMFRSSIGILIGAVIATLVFTLVTGHISYSNSPSKTRGDILSTALLKSTVALALVLVAWVVVMVAAS